MSIQTESKALKTRDEQTKEKPPTLKQEAEAKFKEIDALYTANPSQELLTARLWALAALMSR